ncbi:extracellular solute-binding protein [Egibacter rhizosphaerae]|uniref:Extracellular solute-binding protein n=1 Tax=Egibacter rhizosphaerae TaxID=1670831 RepID=A0A411YIH4_9ACTN|nr:extracellular solute-binding protein [Egibacter rhizosphaerae]QBI20929.1 extracellular solute-binding protein [Egibacter rhizosphaerae]
MLEPRRYPLVLLALMVSLGLLAAACAEDGDPVDDVADDEPEDTPADEEEPDEDPPEDEDEDEEDDDPDEAAAAEDAAQLTIIENAVRGGQNSETAEWLIEDAIPAFEEQMAEEGRPVQVELEETGVDDEDYKTQLALDLSVGEGADIMGFDQFWVSEFYAAEYLEPLDEVVGPEVDEWEGWDQIPEAVAGSLEVDDQRFGVPAGTDGRVLFYRRDLFDEAGLDPDWEPESWEDILDAARELQGDDPDMRPLQINAGTPMGEATTMQGFLPVLLGTGAELYDGGWLGESEELREALGFYETIYREEELGDADLQLGTDAREASFEAFSEGEIAILGESDWFWRDVVEPDDGQFPIEDREEIVGYTKFPAQEPGAGIRGQDHVSVSGGTGRVLNPHTEHPEEAWEFLAYLGSEEAQLAFVERQPRITAREDVNAQAVEDDPMLTFVAEEILDITAYRPGFEEYPQVSETLQLATENVVSGRESVDEAVERYEIQLEGIVDPDDIR